MFRLGNEFFVLKPDLLALLEVKNLKLIHMQKADMVDPAQFKIWAKNEGLKVGNHLSTFITVNKSLLEFLIKFDETVTVANTLRSLCNL